MNEVRTRGGRLGFGRGRESFRRDVERRRNWDRARDHEMDYDLERERYKDRYNDRSMERDRYSDRSRNGVYERGHEDHDLLSEHFSDRDHETDRDLEGNEQGHSRNHEQGWGKRNHTVESDREREMDRTDLRNNIVDKDRDQHSRRWNR